MAGVRFGGPDYTLAGFVLLLRPKRFEAGELDGVPNRCAGRVAFDKIHLGRRPTRGPVGSVHRTKLALAAGSEKAALDVVGQPDRANDRTDPVAVLPGVRQALQDEYTGSFADHQAVALVVERRAPSRRRDG